MVAVGAVVVGVWRWVNDRLVALESCGNERARPGKEKKCWPTERCRSPLPFKSAAAKRGQQEGKRVAVQQCFVEWEGGSGRAAGPAGPGGGVAVRPVTRPPDDDTEPSPRRAGPGKARECPDFPVASRKRTRQVSPWPPCEPLVVTQSPGAARAPSWAAAMSAAGQWRDEGQLDRPSTINQSIPSLLFLT